MVKGKARKDNEENIMFELKIATGTNRSTVMAQVTDTIADVLRKNDISTQGATLALDGRILQIEDVANTFESYGIRQSGQAQLSVTVKADSACR